MTAVTETSQAKKSFAKTPEELQSSRAKTLGFAIIAITVVEAVLAFFVFFKPLFINPVYQMAQSLTEGGNSATVVLFKGMGQSIDDAGNTIINLGLSPTLINIAVIYLFFAVLPIILAFPLMKRHSFAVSFFESFYIVKALLASAAFVLPYQALKTASLLSFSAIIFAISGFLVWYFFRWRLNEAMDELHCSDDERLKTKEKIKLSIPVFALSGAFIALHTILAQHTGYATSLFLGWESTEVLQGFTYLIIFAVFIVGTLLFIKGAEVGIFFVASFASAFAFADIFALISRIIRAKNPENEIKLMSLNTILFAVQILICGALAFFTVRYIVKNINKVKPEGKEEKLLSKIILFGGLAYLAALVLAAFSTINLGTGTGKISFILLKPATWGTLDFIYVGVGLGLALTAVFSMFSGYNWAKYYSIFTGFVFAALSIPRLIQAITEMNAVIAANPGFKGINYKISIITLLLSIIIFAGYSVVLIIFGKPLSEYLYKKKY